MRPPAKLSGELLARKGQALPTGGFAYATIALDQPLPPPGTTALVRYAAAPACDAVAPRRQPHGRAGAAARAVGPARRRTGSRSRCASIASATVGCGSSAPGTNAPARM